MTGHRTAAALLVLAAACASPSGADLFKDKACGGLGPPARATGMIESGPELTAATAVATLYVKTFGNVDDSTDAAQWRADMGKLTAGAAAEALPDRPQEHLEGAKALQSDIVALDPLRASATGAAFLAKVEEHRRGSVRSTTYRAFYTLTLKQADSDWHVTGAIYESQGPC